VVPTVETARLRLRALHETDLDAHAALLGDPETVRFLGGHIVSREDAWRKLLSGFGMWAILGFGYWTVEDRADGTYLGQVGFADFKRGVMPPVEGLPEMGWMLSPRAQGKGIATEAALGALAWADQTWGRREIVAIIDEANIASIRVAEKTGFSSHEPATYKDEPILIFRRR
jgi:RimJ/RimL family protein N-acetyltransferase